MTEFIDQARLHEIARVTDHVTLSPAHKIPSLTWVVDPKTGRPIGHWDLHAADDAPQMRV